MIDAKILLWPHSKSKVAALTSGTANTKTYAGLDENGNKTYENYRAIDRYLGAQEANKRWVIVYADVCNYSIVFTQGLTFGTSETLSSLTNKGIVKTDWIPAGKDKYI